jgi:3-phenylpropionate/trans-cinnamate dioxygenase ferredoxin reductase component
MNTSGLVVVGSGPAGVSAAETFRQHNADLPVRILTDDPDVPYARPPLSKEYLRGETDDVALHPAQWFDEHRIELTRTEKVDGIELAQRDVVAGGARYPYRSLVLACGARPSPLPVPGAETALQLRSLADAWRLRDASRAAGSAVIIGPGFIGCEAAASLAVQGLGVTLVAPDSAPQTQRLGAEAGERILKLLNEAGVRYAGGVSVNAIADGAVQLDNGVTIEGDLIVAATGVQPRSELAEMAGLALSDSRITVGADMRTSARNVYAAGDAALAFNSCAGRPLVVEHWQDAVDQGAVAGANAAGESAKWDGVPGFWTTIGTRR